MTTFRHISCSRVLSPMAFGNTCSTCIRCISTAPNLGSSEESSVSESSEELSDSENSCGKAQKNSLIDVKSFMGQVGNVIQNGRYDPNNKGQLYVFFYFF